MRRQPLRLTLGDVPFEVLPDGRVQATLPAARLPIKTAVKAGVIYPSLRVFLRAMLNCRDSPQT